MTPAPQTYEGKYELLPVRFCVHDKKLIPAERAARGADTCSNDCRNADKNGRRRWLASKRCRLCKRPPMRPPRQTVKSADPVLFKTGAPGAQTASVARGNGGRR